MSDILFGNNNTKTIKHLSKQYFKKNKVRNLAAILAIVLTAFLFTSITSLAFNMVSSMQLSSVDTFPVDVGQPCNGIVPILRQGQHLR